MDIIVKARGGKLTPDLHELAEHKMAKVEHIDPKASRAEVEIINGHAPHLGDGIKRVEVAVDIPRKTFRAHAEGPTTEAALDKVLDKLGRQIREYHNKKHRAVVHGGARVKANQVGTVAAIGEPDEDED